MMDGINHPLPLSAELGYFLLTGLRVVTSWAALLMLVALTRYTRAAMPPPYAPANIWYWLRYWWEVHWREAPALKLGGALVAVALMLQVWAGPTVDLLSRLTPYQLYLLCGLFLSFTGMAQFLNTLTGKIRSES